MKTVIALTVFAVSMTASARDGIAADAATNWIHHCAPCHGKDGAGDNTMGRKLGVKNYRDSKVEAAFSDAEMGASNQGGREDKWQGDDETIREQAFGRRCQGACGLHPFVQEMIALKFWMGFRRDRCGATIDNRHDA